MLLPPFEIGMSPFCAQPRPLILFGKLRAVFFHSAYFELLTIRKRSLSFLASALTLIYRRDKAGPPMFACLAFSLFSFSASLKRHRDKVRSWARLPTSPRFDHKPPFLDPSGGGANPFFFFFGVPLVIA